MAKKATNPEFMASDATDSSTESENAASAKDESSKSPPDETSGGPSLSTLGEEASKITIHGVLLTDVTLKDVLVRLISGARNTGDIPESIADGTPKQEKVNGARLDGVIDQILAIPIPALAGGQMGRDPKNPRFWKERVEARHTTMASGSLVLKLLSSDHPPVPATVVQGSDNDDATDPEVGSD